MKKYELTVQSRVDGEKKWDTVFTLDKPEDAETILAEFAEDMVAHYMGKSTIIKRVTRKQNYNGTATYTVLKQLGKSSVRLIYTLSVYC